MKSDLDYLEEALIYLEDNTIKYIIEELIRQAKDIKHEESQKPNITFDPNWD